MEELYTIKEVAEYLKVTTDAVHKWVRSGKLKAFKIGGVVRVSKSNLEDFISKEK